jgi:hypothetical protein
MKNRGNPSAAVYDSTMLSPALVDDVAASRCHRAVASKSCRSNAPPPILPLRYALVTTPEMVCVDELRLMISQVVAP